MTDAFNFEIRALLCENCGAPIQLAPSGGRAVCAYCQTVNVVTPRVDLPAFSVAPGTPLSEDERLRQLRAQTDRVPRVPPAVLDLLENSEVPAWKIPEAFSIWQTTRAALAVAQNYESAELLLYLTTFLAQSRSLEADPKRERALLEGALDVLTLPRHRQILFTKLSGRACYSGDFSSAEQWLSRCDAHSADLESDTNYRVGRAVLDTYRRDYAAVVRTLGARADAIPSLKWQRVMFVIFRANALERVGDLAAARRAFAELPQASPGAELAAARCFSYYQALELCQTCRIPDPLSPSSPAIAAAPLAPAAGEAPGASVDSNRAGRGKPGAGALVLLIFAAVLALIFVQPVSLGLLGGPYQEALTGIASCDASRALLGDNVGLSLFGFPYGKSFGDSGGFSARVSGSKATGGLTYGFHDDHVDSWSVTVGSTTVTQYECKNPAHDTAWLTTLSLSKTPEAMAKLSGVPARKERQVKMTVFLAGGAFTRLDLYWDLVDRSHVEQFQFYGRYPTGGLSAEAGARKLGAVLGAGLRETSAGKHWEFDGPGGSVLQYSSDQVAGTAKLKLDDGEANPDWKDQSDALWDLARLGLGLDVQPHPVRPGRAR